MIYEVFRQERKGQPLQHAGTVDGAGRALRRDLRARAVRAPAGIGRSLARAARRGERDRGVPRRVRDEVPPRGRVLDQGAAARGAGAGGDARGGSDGGHDRMSERTDLLTRHCRRRALPRLAQLGVDRDRALPRGRRRVLVDRPERDRARAGALRAGRGRARNDRRRARVRPHAGRVSLRTARPAPATRMGADDRAALAVRDRRRDPPGNAQGLRRP